MMAEGGHRCGRHYLASLRFDQQTFTNASATIKGVTGGITSSSWQSQAINIGSKGINQDITSVTANAGSECMLTFGSGSGGGNQPGAVRASTFQPSNTARPTGLLGQASSTVPGQPQVILTGSAVASGYRPLVRPARAIARPTAIF